MFWLVPDEAARTAATRENSPTARFARGVKLIADGQYTAGLPLVRGADLQTTPLAAYAQYYTGVALAGLGRLDEAQTVLTALDKRDPAGYLEEAVPLQLADIAMSARDTKAALEQLEDLSDEKLSAPEEDLPPPRTRRGSGGRSREGPHRIPPRVLRLSAERAGVGGAVGDGASRGGIAGTAGSIQAGAGPRRAAVQRAALGAGARGVCAAGARGVWRRP